MYPEKRFSELADFFFFFCYYVESKENDAKKHQNAGYKKPIWFICINPNSSKNNRKEQTQVSKK